MTPLQQDLKEIRCRICEKGLPLGPEGKPRGEGNLSQWLDTQQPDGSWKDIQYTCEDLKDWNAAQHLNRLLIMAHAWYQPNNPGYKSKEILAAIFQGLDYWYETDPINPNWWWNEIGAPMALGNCLLYLMDVCGAERIQRAVPAFERFLPGTRFTGQNLVWVACVRIRHGILLAKPELASEGYAWIGNEVVLHPRAEGIQPDMSFFQHGLLLYSGGYGAGFIDDVADFIHLADGTAYAWPAEKVELLASLILDGTRWMVRGETFDYGSIGREITRAGHTASRFYRACQTMAKVNSTRQKAFQRIAAVPADERRGRSWVTGNRHFWCADLMTHHRPNFYASIRLASNRVLNADMPCCGGEGRRCHHLADGATLFSTRGNEYRDLFPVWNWRQIPGTTVVQSPDELSMETVRHYGETGFAGGASDGEIGCAAMDFSRDILTLRKAFFCFDHLLFCLGAGLCDSSGHSVRTTLDQCRLQTDEPVCQVDAAGVRPVPPGQHTIAAGTRIVHNRLAYTLLSGTAALNLGEQSGSWSACGVGSDERISEQVFNLGIDHGRNPAQAEYAYWVEALENQPSCASPAQPVRVLANTSALQAVWHETEQRGQAVFYSPGTVLFSPDLAVAVDRACILLVTRHADGRLALTVADPTQKGGSVRITLTGTRAVSVFLPLPDELYAGRSTGLVLYP